MFIQKTSGENTYSSNNTIVVIRKKFTLTYNVTHATAGLRLISFAAQSDWKEENYSCKNSLANEKINKL